MPPRFRMSLRHPGRRRTAGEYPFFPNHFIRSTIAILATIAVVSTLTAIYPVPLGHMADTLSAGPPAPEGPARLLRPIQALNLLFGSPIITLLFTLLVPVLFALIPFFEHLSRGYAGRILLVYTPFLFWMLFVFLTSWVLPMFIMHR